MATSADVPATDQSLMLFSLSAQRRRDVEWLKQMAEADEEKSAYTILRKVGFSQQEILRGVYVKQAFNFGIPLLIGLLHSYFAVKSGWFLFGSELIAPLLITMGLYILMYTLFTWLSIRYYKSIIHQAL